MDKSENYMRFFESYKRAPVDEVNNTPKAKGDFRERLERETIRGRYGLFHYNLEQYLNRQWRAFTVPRVFMFWALSLSYTGHSMWKFTKVFPNLD